MLYYYKEKIRSLILAIPQNYKQIISRLSPRNSYENNDKVLNINNNEVTKEKCYTAKSSSRFLSDDVFVLFSFFFFYK